MFAESIVSVFSRRSRTSTRRSVSVHWLQPAPTSPDPTSLCQLARHLSPAASPHPTPACMDVTSAVTALPLTTVPRASWWRRHLIRIGEEERANAINKLERKWRLRTDLDVFSRFIYQKIFLPRGFCFIPALTAAQTAEKRRRVVLRTWGWPCAACLSVDKTTWVRGASLRRRGSEGGEDMEDCTMLWARRVWWPPQKASCPLGTSTCGPHEGPTSLTNSRSSNHLKVREKGSAAWAARQAGSGKANGTEELGQRKGASEAGVRRGRVRGTAGMGGHSRRREKKDGGGRGKLELG